MNYYSKKRYDSVTLSGTFIEIDRNTCDFETINGWRYRKALRNFLSNQRSKIVKLYDGQIWMACVVDQIQEGYDGHPDNVITTINIVEVGDVESNRDLYYHGFANFLEVHV